MSNKKKMSGYKLNMAQIVLYVLSLLVILSMILALISQ